MSYGAQSLYVSLLTLVDDWGRYDARVALLYGECFVLRSDSNPQETAAFRSELREVGLIEIYEVEGKEYLQLTNWQERKRGPSKFPDQPAGNRSNPQETAAESRLLSLSPSLSPKSEPEPESSPLSPPDTHAQDAGLPTWEEVKAEAGMRNVPEASAKKFFEHHQNNSLWVNQFQRLINWREKLTTWAVKDREISSIAEPKKRNPDAPTMTAVKDLMLEKWGDDPRWQNWAVSFYNFWSDPRRDWKHKDGKKIDWQIELSKQVTRWKSDSAN